MECREGLEKVAGFLQETSSKGEFMTIDQLAKFLNGKTHNKAMSQKLSFFIRKGVDLEKYSYFRTWKLDHLEHLLMELVMQGVIIERSQSVGFKNNPHINIAYVHLNPGVYKRVLENS